MENTSPMFLWPDERSILPAARGSRDIQEQTRTNRGGKPSRFPTLCAQNAQRQATRVYTGLQNKNASATYNF
ncbi:MAG: hypothetical protein WB952_00795 [Terriglobales bacterium]